MRFVKAGWQTCRRLKIGLLRSVLSDQPIVQSAQDASFLQRLRSRLNHYEKYEQDTEQSHYRTPITR